MIDEKQRHRHSGLSGDGEKIRYSDLEGTPADSGNTPFIGNFSITSTGNIIITGIPFKPSMIEFDGITYGNCSGTGVMTAINQWSMFTSTVNGSGFYAGACIYLLYGSVTGVLAGKVSMNANGFTINVSIHNNDALIGYKAYP